MPENDTNASPMSRMGVPPDISDVIMEAVRLVWTREGLSHRERSLITISALVALGQREPLRVHLKGGLENGLTPSELYEGILHVAFYAGLGAAVDVFPILQEVLDETGAS